MIKTIGKAVETEDVICDLCGESADAAPKDGAFKDFEYMKLRAYWGYFSNHDSTTWEAEFCESCSMKIRNFVESLGGKIRDKFV